MPNVSLDRKKMIDDLNKMAAQNVIRSPAVYQRMRNPALLRFYYYIKSKPLIDRLGIDGSSPPDLFVGRLGYPHVFIGPLVPPTQGDTSIMGIPEQWVGKTMDDIVNFRMQLVRGMSRVKVTDVNRGKVVEMTQELALAKNSSYVEAEFTKKPFARIRLDDEVQPHGPSAPLKSFDVYSTVADQKIEKAFYDTDLKAAQAVANLYEKGTLISKIQKAFSAGLFGTKKNRRFVPTRWSITAVDSTLSLKNLEEIKNLPLINEHLVYEVDALDNRWFVIMFPSEWSYELIEAWYPKTVWNPNGLQTMMYSSYENFDGRKTYAEIGGCYYAARLAVTEKLKDMRRQAAVLILREVHPGYLMPVGVWNVREHVRLALKNNPKKFNTLQESLHYVFSKLDIPEKNWYVNSSLLQNKKEQKKIFEFLKYL